MIIYHHDFIVQDKFKTTQPSLKLTLTGLASLAVSHVVEDILHRATVRQVALPYFSVGLLPSLTFVCMEQEHQLLLD